MKDRVKGRDFSHFLVIYQLEIDGLQISPFVSLLSLS